MNLEEYFPFFIILIIGLWRLFKKKKKEEKSSPPLPPKKRKITQSDIQSFQGPFRRMPQPPAHKKPVVPQEKPPHVLQVKKDTHYQKTKTKKRITSVVSSLESKKKLILISEILKKPKGL